MNLKYILSDYRLKEINKNSAGIHLGSPPKTNFDAMSDEEYEEYFKNFDYDAPSNWIWDGEKPLVSVADSYERESGNYEDRPTPTTISYAGRKFIVWYYHNGQPMTVREIDS